MARMGNVGEVTQVADSSFRAEVRSCGDAEVDLAGFGPSEPPHLGTGITLGGPHYAMDDDRGMALVGVLVLSALLLSLAVALALNLVADTRLRGALGNSVTGFYAAESGLSRGLDEFQGKFLDDTEPPAADFDERHFALGTRDVAYKLTERAGNPQNVAIPSGEVFAGLNARQYRYTLNATATSPNRDLEAAVGAEFLVAYIPLFQFAALFGNDLEIAPGPPMHLQGRVHTNGDLYLNGTNGPLYIEDNPPAGVRTVQVSAGKGIYRGAKRENSCDGTLSIDRLADDSPSDNSLDPRELGCDGTTTREVPTAELAEWNGSMLSSLGSVALPKPDIIKPPAAVSAGGGDPGIYWNHADLRIVLRVDQNGQLPGGAILPHRIDVVGAGGAVDPVRSARLQAFMSDAAWNVGQAAGRGPSSSPGTMPIFITDVPSAGSGCIAGNPVCANAASDSYAPSLPASPQPPLGPRTLTPGVGVYSELMGQGDPLGGPFTFDLDYRRGGFYNWREKKWMLLLNINLRDLLLWNQQNGEPFFATADTSDDGLVIFATIDGPSSAARNNYGVRIFGSADLPLAGGIDVSADPTGVTVVSDQAIYVLGDFNRGTAAGGPARQPASLVGDSVNVLSQAYWRSAIPGLCGANCCISQFCRDGQSTLPLADAARNAQTTWVNAAFLGGVDITPDGFPGRSFYNGGLENYPRFHEDWSGQALNYQGSFVSLGEPAHVGGRWCGTGAPCDIYDPPDRNWNFDPGFNRVANLPPLTPRFVYVEHVLFTEDFR
jgi:hypothetical protein